MTKMASSKQKATRGYTLIELVVAVGVFALVMTLVSGAYLMMIALTRQSHGTAIGIDNLSFALETMTRTIRTGTNYSCGGGDCSGGSSLSLVDSGGETVTYSYSASNCANNDSACAVFRGALPLTDASIVKISSLLFYVSGTRPASEGDDAQPYVTIVISGTVSSGPHTTDSFTVETGAAMRQTDL